MPRKRKSSSLSKLSFCFFDKNFTSTCVRTVMQMQYNCRATHQENGCRHLFIRNQKIPCILLASLQGFRHSQHGLFIVSGSNSSISISTKQTSKRAITHIVKRAFFFILTYFAYGTGRVTSETQYTSLSERNCPYTYLYIIIFTKKHQFSQ